MADFPVSILIVILAGVGLLSLLLAPRVRTAEGQGKIMKNPYVARLPARFDFENISHVVS